MKIFGKILGLFKRKPLVVPPAPLFADAEFLEFIAAQARTRTREEQAGNSTRSASPLGKAA